MNKSRRKLLTVPSLAALGAVTLPPSWVKPVLSSIVLPAHAMTSAQCSTFVTEPINSAIVFDVEDDLVIGPYLSIRTGDSFTTNETLLRGNCANSQPREDRVILTGMIDNALNQITGDLFIEVYCGDVLACRQETSFIANQTSSTGGSVGENGTYQGTLSGTIECCSDFDLL